MKTKGRHQTKSNTEFLPHYEIPGIQIRRNTCTTQHLNEDGAYSKETKIHLNVLPFCVTTAKIVRDQSETANQATEKQQLKSL